jgi:MFS family permease
MIGHPLQRLRRAGIFGWIYLSMFFLSIFFFSLQYINAPFLQQYLSVGEVGLLFAIASALSALVLGIAPTLIRMFGTYHTATAILLLLYVATLLIAFHTNIGIIFASWTLYFLLIPLIYFIFDMFLESNVKNEDATGGIRSIILTMGTLAALTAPLLASFIIGDTEAYQSVFLFAAGCLIPLFIIVAYRFNGFIDPPYTEIHPHTLLFALRHNADIRNVSIIRFLLRLYSATIIIYMPIYLHGQLEMQWQDIGVVLFITLIPYLLLEIPSGFFADKKIGEKEMLVAGLVITAASTASLSLITTPSLLLWGVGLFLLSTGESLVNTMSEIYFFKKVDSSHTDIIVAFRLMRPLAIVAAPLLVSLFLLFGSLSSLWVYLGVVIALGIPCALQMKDTR